MTEFIRSRSTQGCQSSDGLCQITARCQPGGEREVQGGCRERKRDVDVKREKKGGQKGGGKKMKVDLVEMTRTSEKRRQKLV